MILNFTVLKGNYFIYKFKHDEELPDWIYFCDFYSVTKTTDEISVVTSRSGSLPEGTEVNKDWRILKINGPLDFSLIGIIAGISNILKQEKISIFTISTYDTDYILVGQKDLSHAVEALREKGHNVISES